MHLEPPAITFKKFLIVIVFGIAFAYIESSVVVYLRSLLHPAGFNFPVNSISVTDPITRPLLLTEIGREAATIVLIITCATLAGVNRQQRFAYFLTIFAVWDIFYYVWLRVLIMWPTSIMDWDILFLIPMTWASAVLYPVIVAFTMLVFAMVLLYRDSVGRPIKAGPVDWLGFTGAAVIIIVSFCTPGPYVTEPDYASHFHWPLFAAGYAVALAFFLRCVFKSGRTARLTA